MGANYPSVVYVPTLTNARFRPRIAGGKWRLHVTRDDNYVNSGDGSQQVNIDDYQLLSEKGEAGGYAELDGYGLVPTDQLGTGTANNTTFLRGDGVWAAVGGITPAGTDWSHVSNTTTDRTADMNATTVDELADIVGTLIADLRTTGIIS